MTAHPTSINCGSCGASTALSWESVQDFSVGIGFCPLCSRTVFSFVGDSLDLAALDRFFVLRRQVLSGLCSGCLS